MKILMLIFFLAIPVLILYSQSEESGSNYFDTSRIILPDSIARDTAYARKLYSQGYESITNKNYSLAFHKADTARHINIKALGTQNIAVSDCILLMGMSLYFQNDYNKTIYTLSKALKIAQEIKQEYTRSASIGYSYLGLTYMKLSQFDKAIACHMKNLEIRLKIYSEDDINIATTYHQIGNTYLRMGDYDQALIYHHLALNIRQKHNRGVAASYQSLGTIYKNIGDYKTAIDYNLKALDMAFKIVKDNHVDIALGYNNLANCFKANKEFDKAIEYHLKALNIYISELPEDHPDIAMSYSNLGNCYREKGLYNKALEFQHLALQFYLRTFDQDKLNVSRVYDNLFAIHTELGDNIQALDFLNKSLGVKLSILSEDHPIIADSYMNLGLVYTMNDDMEKGLEYYLKAYDIYSVTNKYHFLADLCINIGNNYFKNNLVEEALSYYKNSIYYFNKFNDPTHFLNLKVLNKITSVYISINNTDSAQIYSDMSIDVIKQQVLSDVSVEAKSYFQYQNLPIFENAIELAIALKEGTADIDLLHNTFTYSEMAKATLLQHQVKQNEALTFSSIPDSLIHKEKDTRLAISYREKQRRDLIESGKTDTDSTVLRISSIIFDLKRQQEKLISHFEKEYPDYYRLRYDISTISLEETQQNLLQANQSLLEYFVGDRSIYVMVMTKDTFAVHGIKKDFPLDSFVRQLQTGIYGYYGKGIDTQTDELYTTTINLYSDAATALYDKLVRPVSHLLTQDVIIVPDGVLGYVPFEILLSHEPTKIGRFQNYPYLFQDHNVSYSYSATLLKEMKEKKHSEKPKKSILALAPFYTGSYELLDSTINLVFDTLSDGRDTAIFEKVVTRKSFSQLPSSGEEVTTAAKIWEGDYYINKDASRQKFLERAGDYRILHLATHGTADEKDGIYSYLVFAGTQDSIENEFLYVRDLYNTSLNADLVILSACETGVGELQRGEGIVSLARGFAYAGAKSILTTLWVVDDGTTKDLLRDFYVNLRKGQDKNVALRNARINHLNKAKSRYRHPFFWAGFIGIGDMSGLE